MAASDDILAQLRVLEDRVKVGTSTLFDVRQMFGQYVIALAAERKVILPSPLPDMSNYTTTVSAFAGGSQPYSSVEATRNAYVTRLLSASKPTPVLNRATAVKARLDAAIASKAPQATIDALKAEYERLLGVQTDAAKKDLGDAIASGAPQSTVTALQKRVSDAASQEASGKLATSPMREVLTFAILTSPAWLPLLLMKTKIL